MVADLARTIEIKRLLSNAAEPTRETMRRRGIGTLLVQWKGGSAYLIRGETARRIERGRPFVSATLTVTKLSAQGDRFDFNMWCGREPTYEVTVNGRRTDRRMYSPRIPTARRRKPHPKVRYTIVVSLG